MNTRPLGSSNLSASVVGFGAWAIGGWTWGGADEQDAIDAIRAFLDAGGNLIDTAPIYGFGASEEIVGKAIAGRRDEVVLATKCGMRWDLSDRQKKRARKKFSTTPKMIVTGSGGTQDEPTFDVYIYNGADGIREEVERSLRRLKTDRIDLYQTHWQDDPTPIEERMETLLTLKKEGKIRAVGTSNASPEQIDAYRKFGPVDSDQEKFSMLDRDHAAKNLELCAKENIAMLAYSPLAQGLLTGKIGPDRQYPDDDQRSHLARFKPDNVKKVQRMLDPMRPIAERHGISLTQLAMAWTLAQPGCSHVLCGARNPRQAIDNAGAGNVSLSEKDLAKISEAAGGYDGV